jgi:hypothetical protein
MKKVVSLCVFGKNEDYWKCSLQAIINNSIVYKDFIVRLYISSFDYDHILVSVLEEMYKCFPFFELGIVDKKYVSLEATMWRMLPLWDADVDVFLCRDVDAFPVSMEVKSTYYFLNHAEYDIHGIRSYISHGGLCLMAGLCGFKKERFKHLPGVPTYEDYEKYTYHISWGGDQEALKQYFYKFDGTKHLVTLDTVLGNCSTEIFNPSVFNPSRVSIEEYKKEDISFIQPTKILEWGDDGRVEYAGQHQYFNIDIFKASLELDCDVSRSMKKCIENNEKVKLYLGM